MATPFFTRRKEVVIEREAADRFRFVGVLEDDVHHIRATLLVAHPSMTILEASGEMVKGTNPPFCAGAVRVLDGLVGERLHRGFARVAQERVGSSLGCPHLMEIVTDMGRAAFQVTMLLLREKVKGNPAEVARLAADPLARRRFVLASVPQLENTCWAFNRENDRRFEEQAGKG